MNEQEFTEEMLQRRYEEMKEGIPLALALLRSWVAEIMRDLRRVDAQLLFAELTQWPVSELDNPRFGFDEPLEDMLARDRFLHAVRRRREIDEMCLKSRW